MYRRERALSNPCPTPPKSITPWQSVAYGIGRIAAGGSFTQLNCDLQLTLMASRLYRYLGQRIGHGYETAKSAHLFRDFIDATASIDDWSTRDLGAPPKQAHNPLLLAAGLDKADVRIPWLGNKPLQLVFG